MLELAVISPSGQHVRKLTLPDDDDVVIGRARGAHIQLYDPNVSRRHAIIEPGGERGTWRFRDLGSTHGSFAAGERVKELDIHPGLEIRVGTALLRFDNPASRIGRELDRMLEDEEAGGSVTIEVIGRNGRHLAPVDDQEETAR